MTDVEGAPVVNPYSTIMGSTNDNNFLSAHHPVVVLKRFVFVGVSLFGLEKFSFYNVILRSPHVRHEWFKIGLASTVAFLFIKAYMEILEVKVNKKKVNYANYKQTTHAAIILLLFSSLCYNIALWPHYRWNSLIVLSLFAFGVVLQLMLLVPAWVQNIAGFAALTFFLQEYK